MSVEEYLNTLTEQIRCKQAREAVKEEIEGHINDQIEECVQEGMSQEEAVKYAVLQMGDPVEAGVSLDRIHRPKVAWSMMALVGILSVLGTIVQYMISVQCENVYNFNLASHLVYTLAGFLIMALMYCLDYSFFGKYGKIIAVLFLLYMFLQVFFFGREVNGARIFSSGTVGYPLSLRMVMLLYIPLFGGVLYSYRDGGYKSVIKSILFLLVPVWIAMQMPCLSLALILFFTMMIMLSVAMVKGWFTANGTRFVVAAWGSMIVFPPLFLWAGMKLHWFAEYQIARITSLVKRSDPNGSSYSYYRIREILSNSEMFGKGETVNDISTMLPQVDSDFIITHLISYYGIFSAVIVGTLFFALVFKILKISFRQKNQLGMIVGVGCGSVFGIQIFLYLLENIGMLPYTFLYLPLFSTGGTGIIITYGLLGIILSVYKYQEIPLKVKQKKLMIKI